MSPVSLAVMAAVGLVLLALAVWLLVSGGRRRREQSRYVSRLSGVMLAAGGLILLTFAGAWSLGL